MAKLFFRYGAMGASKSANALMVDYNYFERGQNTLVMKPEIDNRDGESIVKSRIGIWKEAFIVKKESNLFEETVKTNTAKTIHCVIVDEAQFLSREQVKQLSDVVDYLEIPVIAYGLRTDFQGNLFEGSMWLLAWADSIEEIKTVCFCSHKAIMNARICNGKVVKEGEQIMIGGNESYIALCRKHWKEGKIV
ncbi:MAG: thymidine kinase [Candidatus Cloacimonetes bacterium]|nr:thymidine kinase [Candidatus Cloacimonadota bacterium]